MAYHAITDNCYSSWHATDWASLSIRQQSWSLCNWHCAVRDYWHTRRSPASTTRQGCDPVVIRSRSPFVLSFFGVIHISLHRYYSVTVYQRTFSVSQHNAPAVNSIDWCNPGLVESSAGGGKPGELRLARCCLDVLSKERVWTRLIVVCW